MQAYRSEDLKQRMEGLSIAETFYQKDKNNPFPAQVWSDHPNLVVTARLDY